MSQRMSIYPLDQHRRRSCFLSYIQPDPHEQLDQTRRLNQIAEARGYRHSRTEAPPTQAEEPPANQDQEQEPISSRANIGYIDLTTGNKTSSSNSSSTEHDPTPPSTLAPARPDPTIYTYSQNSLLRPLPELEREIAILRRQMRTDLLLLGNSVKRLSRAIENRNAAARLDLKSRTAPTTTQMDFELDGMWICSFCGRTKDITSHQRCREKFAARLRDQRQRDRERARRMDPNPNPSRNRSRAGVRCVI